MEPDKGKKAGIRRDVPWQYAVAAFLSVLWFALAFHGAWNLSNGMDEVPHIGSGLAVLAHGDFRMNPEHPFLFKVLAVLPLHLSGLAATDPAPFGPPLMIWLEGMQWGWGYYTLFIDTTHSRAAIFLTRIIPIITCFLGGVIGWVWARELAGRRVGHTAGLVAFGALIFYPEYLGHGRYVTFDVPLTVSCATLSWLGWRWYRRPTVKRMVVYAIAAGILAHVKLPVAVFSLLILGGVAVLLLVRAFLPVGLAWAKPRVAASWGGLMLGVVLLGVSGFFFQWAAAGFRFSLYSADHVYSVRNEFLPDQTRGEGLGKRLASFTHEYRLLPETSVAGLNILNSVEGRLVRLFNEVNRTGWRHYFLVTILFKTPLSWFLVSCLLLGVVISGMRGRRGWEYERLFFLLFPFAIFFLMHVESKLNIGHRHVLFVYFPWSVLMGAGLGRLLLRPRWKRVAGILSVLLVVATITESLRSHPAQAVYFNWLGGGSPRTGQGILADSNIDWGQDLPMAARLVRELGYDRVNLAYFGASSPAAWGMTDFNFILPNYPFAVGMPDAVGPDPRLPTVVSVSTIDAVWALYGERFHREPIAWTSSMMIFAPEMEELPARR